MTIWACNNDPAEEWSELDLLPYGIPISIMAPDSADVNMSNLGVMKDITVKKGNEYNVQIFASPLSSDNLGELKASQLEEVKSNRFFSQIITDEPNGFIYETVIDSNNINYGFRHVYYQADLEYVFQQSLVGSFTQEQIEKMYKAIKQGE
ncbi:MAG: hypothetical protein DWQ02_04320 [Bacteroidetes bacterium]|nr:MAG: hypothetical protein DWQ02_04320 [Bacteroidota bacterium]